MNNLALVGAKAAGVFLLYVGGFLSLGLLVKLYWSREVEKRTLILGGLLIAIATGLLLL